jgi:hypothetical protein
MEYHQLVFVFWEVLEPMDTIQESDSVNLRRRAAKSSDCGNQPDVADDFREIDSAIDSNRYLIDFYTQRSTANARYAADLGEAVEHYVKVNLACFGAALLILGGGGALSHASGGWRR